MTKGLFGHYTRILVNMDFSRKLFHEIVVEREGFDFTVEVAYEWLPDFRTHYQSIGHDVTACRRLYPRKETTTTKEQIAQGKKHVPIKKANWVPTKENPSRIGSSAAFGSTKGNDSVPINVNDETEAIPQQNLDVYVPVQNETTTLEKETETVTLEMETETVQQESMNLQIFHSRLPLRSQREQQGSVQQHLPSKGMFPLINQRIYHHQFRHRW
ncbi:hypothetical protein MTR_8g041780 [Medicago truncatula]|uniref:DUF4283 domain protein n=1 Tax=Medicago truncatula TaxID=3880 RepID=Q1S5L4_MEDTR|nr:hypothetical protein MtrDRAFT_AC147431g26v2 [Medicago truncatula]AET02520.1 hypothetical protein MTR_8g041780 [Medicago truncatula]